MPHQAGYATAFNRRRSWVRFRVLAHQLWVALVLASATALAPLALAKAPYPFEIEARQQGSEHMLIGKNRGPAPISVRVDQRKRRNRDNYPGKITVR